MPADWDSPRLVESNRYLPGSVDEEFQKTLADFPRWDPDARVGWLQSYDNAIAEDGYGGVSRGLAQLVSQRRQLSDLHYLLLRNCR